MTPPVKQVSFAAGEVSPTLYARTDLNRYEIGLRAMRNFIAMRQGGATNRPGTQYVGTTLNGGNPVRLIPFIFNETGLGQSYMLEFGNQYIAFYQNGGVVVTAPNTPYIVSTFFFQAGLSQLSFDQCNDVLTITNQFSGIYELRRLGPTNWTLTTPSLSTTIQGPIGVTASGGGSGTTHYQYLISAINASGDESLYSTPGIGQLGNVFVFNVNPVSITNPISLTWTAEAGIISYRVYRQQITHSGDVISGVGFISPTINNFFTDTFDTPDYLNPPPISNLPAWEGLFNGDNPGVVAYIQQRRGFANWPSNPIGFILSKTGSLSNYSVHLTPLDDDAIYGTIAGSEVNAINALEELKFMLMLTSGAEIYVQGDGSGVVTPSQVNAAVQSHYGASSLRPIKIGDVLLFAQSLGSSIRDFSFDFASDGYRGNDITIFSAHLFEKYQMKDWCLQKVPDSLVWIARSDGTLLCCTYVREQQILAWSRHDFTNGFVENVCAIPENGEYAVYLSIRRVINGATVRYIERMSSRLWSDPIDATYLDCFVSFDGRNTDSSITMFLSPSLGGLFVTDDTAYQQALQVLCTGGSFVGFSIGDQVFFEDDLWIQSQGTKGNQIRCSIVAIDLSDLSKATAYPNRVVPPEFQFTAISTWARAVQTVAGLSYLQGQEVSIWADRYVVGSPLNSQISTVYTVPSNGILTLDKCYSVIHIGLPMVSDLQTLDLETSFGETELSRRKKINRFVAYVYNTRTFFAGTENPDTNSANADDDLLYGLEEFKRGSSMSDYDQPPELTTDQDYVLTEARWNKNGRVFLRNVDPVPCTILAISPQGDDPVQQPTGKRV